MTNINKKANRGENPRCFKIAMWNRLKVKALMSVGQFGESSQAGREAREWLLKARPDDFDVTLLTAHPATPYFDDAVPHPTEPDVWIYTCEKAGNRLHGLEVE